MPAKGSKYQAYRQQFRERLKGFKAYLEQQNYAPGSIAAFINYTSDFFFYLSQRLLAEKNVRYTDLLQYIDHCRKQGNASRMINRKLASVRKYYRYLQQQGRIRKNPAAGLQIRTGRAGIPTDMLTMKQLSELYDKYQVVDLRSKRNKVILSVLIHQGLTTDELHRMEPAHLKLRSGKIWIPGSRHSGSRTLELKANQVILLQEYVTTIRPEILLSIKKKTPRPARKPVRIDWQRLENQLFISMNGSVNIKNNLHHLMKELKRINPRVRSCRHIRQSVITHWLKMYDIREVQYMAGHKRISSTEWYQVGQLEDLKVAIDKYHPLG